MLLMNVPNIGRKSTCDIYKRSKLYLFVFVVQMSSAVYVVREIKQDGARLLNDKNVLRQQV